MSKYYLYGLLCTVEPKKLHNASPGTLAYGVGTKNGNREVVFFYQGEQAVERLGSLDAALQSEHKDKVDAALEEGDTVRGDFSHFHLSFSGDREELSEHYYLGDGVFQTRCVGDEELPDWVAGFRGVLNEGVARDIILSPQGTPIVVKEYEPSDI